MTAEEGGASCGYGQGSGGRSLAPLVKARGFGMTPAIGGLVWFCDDAFKFRADGWDYSALISRQVTSSCCGVEPTNRSRLAIRRSKNSFGVADAFAPSRVITRDSSYSS